MDMLSNWIYGHMSAAGRIWSALAPAILIALYFVGGLIIYSIRTLFVGQYRDSEMESRGSSFLASMYIRLYFTWIMQPIWRVLIRMGVPANAITTLSVLLATASGVSLSIGRFALGGWLYLFAGMCDFFDGRLARARNEVTKKGAALDSILDRYCDAAVLVGLAWYYRDSWVLLATQIALVGSALVPYIRARGEAIGVSIKEVGFMQRAERILYLGVAVAISPILEAIIDPGEPRPLHRIAIAGLVLLAVSTQITALQRFSHLLGALDESEWHKGWLRLGRGVLARGAIIAAAATIVDFFAAVSLVDAEILMPSVATFIATITGTIIHFFLSRIWSANVKIIIKPQTGRYVFVSITTALLNAGGVAVLLLIPGFSFKIAWLLVHISVFLAWNLPLLRTYLVICEPEKI
ncbi:MAG: CDP-alcohol phosphatidyltransferase family protein [Deltaproteobacteria bacterium]|nr:CDP-alcohol phosphatidyltransferase family protein [Deltaproteobacteria bacterium]